MRERWIDERAVELFWQERLAPHSAPFTQDLMHEVVDDIVRINDDRSGYTLEENRSYELIGLDGPVMIHPGPVMENTGVNYALDIDRDDDGEPMISEGWTLIEGFRERGRQRVGLLHNVSGPDYETSPSLVQLDEPSIRGWVGYVWDAYLHTPKDITLD